MLKDRGRVALVCATIQAQNTHSLPPYITLAQLLKMTMETTEEVSVQQEVTEESSIIDIKETEGAILACA